MCLCLPAIEMNFLLKHKHGNVSNLFGMGSSSKISLPLESKWSLFLLEVLSAIVLARIDVCRFLFTGCLTNTCAHTHTQMRTHTYRQCSASYFVFLLSLLILKSSSPRCLVSGWGGGRAAALFRKCVCRLCEWVGHALPVYSMVLCSWSQWGFSLWLANVVFRSRRNNLCDL